MNWPEIVSELNRRQRALVVWFGGFVIWVLLPLELSELYSYPVASAIVALLVGGLGLVHGLLFLLLLTMLRPNLTPISGAVLGIAPTIIIWAPIKLLDVLISGAVVIQRLHDSFSFLGQQMIVGLFCGALSVVLLRRT